MIRSTLLGAAFAAAGAAVPFAAAAQPAAGEQLLRSIEACAGVSSVACVAQIGDRNRAVITQRRGEDNTAFVYLDGEGNGRGGIESRTAVLQNTGEGEEDDEGEDQADAFGMLRQAGVRMASGDGEEGDGEEDEEEEGEGTTTMETLALRSGVVRQRGTGNRAYVVVDGDRNRYHVTQRGDDNRAVQVVLGDDNSAAAYQSGREGQAVSDNRAVQVQVGSLNTAYVEQNDANNTAVTVQVGVPSFPDLLGLIAGGAVGLADAELSGLNGFAQRMGDSAENTILLRQTGDNAEAYLAQVGSGHSIALQQGAGAFAAIGQFGANRSVALNQTGTTPIIINQFGF